MSAGFDWSEYEEKVARYSGFSETDQLQSDELTDRLTAEAAILNGESDAAFKHYMACEKSGEYKLEELPDLIDRSVALARRAAQAREAAEQARRRSFDIAVKRQQARGRIVAQNDVFRAASKPSATRLNS